MDEFTKAYLTAALWSSTGDNDEPLDKNHTIDDIHPDALEKMAADCRKFQEENKAFIKPRLRRNASELAGHDFWLTRNRHGAGFWDGDWKEFGEELTAASHRYPETDLYVGDDGKIHI